LVKPALPPKNKTRQCPNVLANLGLHIRMLLLVTRQTKLAIWSIPQTKIKKPSRLNQNGLLKL